MDLQLMKLRKMAGYRNRDDFAEKLGVNKYTYRSWESGTAMMSLEQAYNVTEVLGCTRLRSTIGRPAGVYPLPCFLQEKGSGWRVRVCFLFSG